MKALTLWQPWAQLVALEEKQIETRSWSTEYRGDLAIQAAKSLPPNWLGASRHTEEFRDELADVLNVRRDRDDRAGRHVDDAVREMPRSCVLCVVNLIAVQPIDEMLRDTLSRRERIFGNYEDGRYAWFFEFVKRYYVPIPAKGRQMLWEWKEQI